MFTGSLCNLVRPWQKKPANKTKEMSGKTKTRVDPQDPLNGGRDSDLLTYINIIEKNEKGNKQTGSGHGSVSLLSACLACVRR